MYTLCGSFEDKTKQVSDIGPFFGLSYIEEDSALAVKKEMQ